MSLVFPCLLSCWGDRLRHMTCDSCAIKLCASQLLDHRNSYFTASGCMCVIRLLLVWCVPLDSIQAWSVSPHHVFNLGNTSNPVTQVDYVRKGRQIKEDRLQQTRGCMCTDPSVLSRCTTKLGCSRYDVWHLHKYLAWLVSRACDWVWSVDLASWCILCPLAILILCS